MTTITVTITACPCQASAHTLTWLNLSNPEMGVDPQPWLASAGQVGGGGGAGAAGERDQQQECDEARVPEKNSSD